MDPPGNLYSTGLANSQKSTVREMRYEQNQSFPTEYTSSKDSNESIYWEHEEIVKNALPRHLELIVPSLVESLKGMVLTSAEKG